jgi:hypothetical protein
MAVSMSPDCLMPRIKNGEFGEAQMRWVGFAVMSLFAAALAAAPRPAAAADVIC